MDLSNAGHSRTLTTKQFKGLKIKSYATLYQYSQTAYKFTPWVKQPVSDYR